MAPPIPTKGGFPSINLNYVIAFNISIYILNVFIFFLIQSEEKEVLQARNHYTQAKIDDCIYNLNDDAYVQVCSLSRFLDNYFFYCLKYLFNLQMWTYIYIYIYIYHKCGFAKMLLCLL